MSSSLFTISCPRCGEVLSTRAHEVHSCSKCGQAYLARFGHLVPLESDGGMVRIMDTRVGTSDTTLASTEGSR